MIQKLQNIIGVRKPKTLLAEYGESILYYPDDSDIGKLIASGFGWDGNVGIIISELFGRNDLNIIEVGSNIGATVLQMKIAAPHASIHCFEPSSRYFDLLKKNVRTNSWNNVHLNKQGLSHEAGRLTLYNNESTASIATKLYDGHKFKFAEQIDLITLDQYCQDMQRIDLIKTDTDGYDYRIFQGAKETLKRLKPSLYFEFQISQLEGNGDDPEEFLNYLAGLGYRKFLLFNNFGSPLKVVDSPKQILNEYKKVRFMDILAVHESNTEQCKKLEDLYAKFENGHIKPYVRQPIIRA